MAQLVQMRHRIKAIETTKKITHAMRLISMSTHTRLRAREAALKFYQQELHALFLQVFRQAPAWKHPLTHPEKKESHTLVILVGSQKGLCGNFNTHLFSFFQKTIEQNAYNPYIIAVGKKAVDFATSQYPDTVLQTYSHLNSIQLSTITHHVIDLIQEHMDSFSHIMIISNVLKTFFVQMPYLTYLLPFDTGAHMPQDQPVLDTESTYQWEQDPHEILDNLIMQSLYARVYYLLFQSLIAEQAARFLSMDNSTRNANSLLESARLQYNKLRQTKITQELTELTGSF